MTRNSRSWILAKERQSHSGFRRGLTSSSSTIAPAWPRHRNKGIETTGTLGILDLAAGRRLIRLSEALEMLKRTNFRYRQTILDQLLKQFESGA